MPKRGLRALAASAFFALATSCIVVLLDTSCSTAPPPRPTPPPPPPVKQALPSPEEDPTAPGMIPKECEALLNKTHDWGFQPEKNWRPKSPAEALEAADFFAGFHLVPESTSNFARAWMSESQPTSAFRAEKSLNRMNRAQSCDFLLAHRLLLALLKYPWPRAQRAAVGQDLLRFVLNQQARVSPSVARAVQIDVLGKAVQKGFIRADARAVEKLRKWFDEKTADGLARADEATDPVLQWKLNQDELALSEEAREKLARILPLP